MIMWGKPQPSEEEKKQLEQLNQQIGTLNGTVTQLRQDITERDQRIKTLEATVAVAEGKTRDAESQLATARSQAQSAQGAQAQTTTLQSQVAELQKLLFEARNHVTSLEQELAKTKGGAPATTVQAGIAKVAGTGFQVGGHAWVRQEGGKNLRRRSSPSLQSDVLDSLVPGTQLELLEGPQQADGHAWWRIRVIEGREGWVAGEELQA